MPHDKEEKRDSLPAADRFTALHSVCLRRQVRNDGYKKEEERSSGVKLACGKRAAATFGKE